jgi:hypothetical protein
MEEFIQYSPERRVPVIVEKGQVTIGYGGT